MALMSRSALLDICKEHKLYRTPSLNDKLYCNFKGFTNIDGLDEYTQLRALFLEGNAIEVLENLSALKELRCLYVQQNCIHTISGLDQLTNLDTLNISQNQIRTLEGLSCCPSLRTLICTNNQLASVESIQHLAECKGLHTLDLQNNNISDPAILEQVLVHLPELRCLYLKGNPVVSHIKNYRKALVAALPELRYLDDRPVFEEERRIVNAWAVGGLEGEREERRRIRAEEQERNERNFEMMQALRREGWRKRRQAEGLAEGDTDPMLDDMSDDEYTFAEEPAELVEARARLAAYTARQGEVEPPEMGRAREQRAAQGLPISASVADPSTAEADGQAYLDHLRGNAAEISGKAATAAEDADDAAPGKRDDSSAGVATQAVSGGGAKVAAARHQPEPRGGDDTLPVDQSMIALDMPALELVGDVDLAELD